MSGNTQSMSTNNYSSILLLCTNENNKILNESTIEEQIVKCWRIEEYAIRETYSFDEKSCENYFDNTVVRGLGGKCIVKLPVRDTDVNLDNS